MNDLKNFIVSKLIKIYSENNDNELQKRKKEYEEVKVEFDKQEYMGRNPFKLLWQDMKNKGYNLKSKLKMASFSLVAISPILFNIVLLSSQSFNLLNSFISVFLSLLIGISGYAIFYLLYQIIFDDIYLIKKTDLTIDYENKKQKYESFLKNYQDKIKNIETIFDGKNSFNEISKTDLLNEVIDSETYQYISQNLSQEELKKILIDSFYDGNKSIYYSSIVNYFMKNQAEHEADIISKKMKKQNNYFKVKEDKKEVIFS